VTRAAKSDASTPSASSIMPSFSSTSGNGSVMTTSSHKPLTYFLYTVSTKEQAELDKLWSEAVYTNQLSFNIKTSLFLHDFFQKIRPGWKPPSAYRLAHSLLDETASKVNSIISDAVSKADSISLQLDGQWVVSC